MKRGSKVFALMIFGLLLGSFLVGVVSAGPFDDFKERWTLGKGLTAIEGKLFLVLVMTIIVTAALFGLGLPGVIAFVLGLLVSILFTSYVAPDAIIGIFTSYDILPLMISILLPIIFLFGFSAFAAWRGSRVLMGLQLVFWAVAFIIYAGMAVVQLPTFWGGDWFGWSLISTKSLTANQLQYWWMKIAAGVVITFIMTFFNGWFLNFAAKHFLGIKGEISEANISTAIRGWNAFSSMGKATEGDKKPTGQIAG